MSAVKLTKIGNSQGITLPKELLKKANINLGDSLEVTFYNGKLILFKKRPHHSEMQFNEEQSKEDIDWANEDFGEWDA